MGRSELREHIFRILFRIEFNSEQEMQDQIGMYFDSLESIDEKNKTYLIDKYAKIITHIDEIDKKINEHATGWKTIRMNKVDLTILRLAAYEITWDEEVPVGVAINEAVELAKKYSSDEGPAFINGVLAKFVN
ncbi:transcription antitermination factor NusB [Lachnospiraceae bacterium LCP25S3_G4]